MQDLTEKRPKISVCLLTYNHAPTVTKAIESVLAQDFDDFEVLLSDDCSSDGTWELAKTFEARDPRIRVLRTPRNLGMAGNANFAIRLARAPFVALLHHDDVYARSLLRSWLSVVERHHNVGFVSNLYGTEQDGTFRTWPFPPSEVPFSECNDGKAILEEHLLASWGCPFRGTALIRRSAWDAVGGIREEFGMLADVDLWMRLAARYDVGYVSDPVITVGCERPSYYPTAYWQWSWPRVRLLHQIHAANIRDHYGRDSLTGKLAWFKFRARVTADITKWLGYAVVKRRPEMLTTSHEVASALELPPSVWLRRALAPFARRFVA